MITLKIVTERKMTPEQYSVYLQFLKARASIINFSEMEKTGETTFNHPDYFCKDVKTTYYYKES